LPVKKLLKKYHEFTVGQQGVARHGWTDDPATDERLTDQEAIRQFAFNFECITLWT